MRCEAIEEHLATLLGGLLAEPERGTVEAHLAGCARCSAELRTLQGLWNALGAWPDEEPPLLLTGAVKAEIVRDLRAEGRSRASGPLRLAGGVLLGIVLALASLVFLPGRSAFAEISPALLLSCGAFWAGVFVFASLLVLRPREAGTIDWRGVGVTGLVAMAGSMLLTRSCDVLTLVRACARSRWCGGVTALVGVEGGYFIAGALYAALPLVAASVLLRGPASIRPLHQGAVAGALFFSLLVPAILLQCVPFTAGLVTSWLAGTLLGSLVGGPTGSWVALRLGRAVA